MKDETKTNKRKTAKPKAKAAPAPPAAAPPPDASGLQYRIFFEAASDGILVAGVESKKFLHANPAICRMYGYTEEELLARSVFNNHPPESVNYVISEFEAQARGEKLTAENIPCLRKDGSVFYADINTTSAVIDGQNCNIGFFRDVTNRIATENALRKSEEINKTIVDLTVDYVFIVEVTPAGALILKETSGNLTATTGRTIDEVRTIDAWRKIFHPEDLEKAMSFINSVVASKKTADLETRTLTKQGKQRWIQVFARPVIDEKTKKVVEVIGAVKDISARKNAEQSLRDSETKFYTAFEISPLLMAITTVDEGRFIDANRALLETIGYAKDEFIGKTSLELGFIKDVDYREAALKQIAENGVLRHFELPVTTKSGEIRHGSFFGAPLTLGSAKYFLVIMDDITERKRNEEELEQYKHRLEDLVDERTAELKSAQRQLIEAERLAILGHFAGSVAHEIRNPLAVIDGNIHLLKKSLPKDDERADKYIKTIRKHIKRSVNTIESLLDLTRSDVKKTQTIDLGIWLRGHCENVFMPDNVKINCVGAGKSARVFADVVQLDIAMKNIIKNAAEAMHDGGEITLAMDIIENGAFAEIRVSDTGHGIPPDKLPLIFQPLYTTKFSGFGFGLSLTKIIIERHDGSITASSPPGSGATFTIRLPITNT